MKDRSEEVVCVSKQEEENGESMDRLVQGMVQVRIPAMNKASICTGFGDSRTFAWLTKLADCGQNIFSSDRSSYSKSSLREIHHPVFEILSIFANIFSFSF